MAKIPDGQVTMGISGDAAMPGYIDVDQHSGGEVIAAVEWLRWILLGRSRDQTPAEAWLAKHLEQWLRDHCEDPIGLGPWG